MFSPTELCDQDTIYTPEGFASLFIVCSPRWSIAVRTECVSCVWLALDVSVIQWNHWRWQRLDTGCSAGRTKFLKEIFFKLQLKLMTVPCIFWNDVAYDGTLYHHCITCKFHRVSSSISQFCHVARKHLQQIEVSLDSHQIPALPVAVGFHRKEWIKVILITCDVIPLIERLVQNEILRWI